MNQIEFIARVRGRNSPDKLREITINGREMKKNDVNIDIGEYVKVTIEKMNMGDKE